MLCLPLLLPQTQSFWTPELHWSPLDLEWLSHGFSDSVACWMGVVGLLVQTLENWHLPVSVSPSSSVSLVDL